LQSLGLIPGLTAFQEMHYNRIKASYWI